MKIILLQDIQENTIDAVIVSYETTPKELQEIFNKVKQDKPTDYEWDDFIIALPKDCLIYNVKDNSQCNIVFY